jgi:hypothetical protein
MLLRQTATGARPAGSDATIKVEIYSAPTITNHHQPSPTIAL